MKAIEIGHIVAGPTAGMILTDLGFDVIKVEKPKTGDIARSLSGTSSGAFAFYNRNKKSITLDMKSEEGKEILMKLIKGSDVLIDNLGFGALDSIGITYDNMSKINAGLIYLSIRGYGPGPYEHRKSLDFPIEVHSGLAYMTGLTGKPMRVGASIVDMGAAMFGVISILNALIEREKTRKGKKITIGMFETAEFFVGQHIASYQLINRDLKPINEEGFAWGVYDFFKTSDNKEIFIAVTTDEQWKKFCDIFSIRQVDEYRTNTQRYENRNKLIPEIQKVLLEMRSEKVLEYLDRGNISYAILNRPWDLLEDRHALNNMVSEHFHGKVIKVPHSPVGVTEISDPPSLGQNTDEILLSLGYSDKEIKNLRDKGVI